MNYRNERYTFKKFSYGLHWNYYNMIEFYERSIISDEIIFDWWI